MGTYYFNDLGEDGSGYNAHVSADLSNPAKHANTPTLTDWSASDMIWIGIKVACSNCGKNPTTTNYTIEVKKDSGSWLTLAASDCAAPGSGNMNWTNYNPSTSDFWTLLDTGICSTNITGKMEDADDTVVAAAGSADDKRELWFAIDLSGCAAGSTYHFGVYCTGGDLGSSGSPTELSVDVTIASGTTLTVQDAYHDNVVTPATASFLLQVTPTVNDAYNVLEDEGPLALGVHLDVNDAYNVLEDDGPITITHIVPVVPNDAYHDNVVTPITANFLLTVTPTVNDCYHDLIDEGPLSIGVDLTVNSGSSDLIDDGPITIQEKHILVVNDCYHETQDGGPLTLTQIKTLVVEDCFSLLEDPGPITLTQKHILTCADCNHDLIDPGPITLSVEGAVELVVADAFHLTEDPGPLALAVHLVVADSGHDVESPQINLSAGQNLVVADAFNVLEDDAPLALTQTHILTVADAFDVLEDTGPFALTQTHILVVSDCENAVESPQINLVSGLELAVSDAYHEHLSSAISLSQIHDLALNSAYHQHDLEGDLILTTTGPVELVLASGEHTLTDDLSAITQLHILTVDSCEDAVVSAQITITHVMPSALGDIVDPSIWSRTVERYLVSLTTERTIHHS